MSDANTESYLSLLKSCLLDELYLENEARLFYLFRALVAPPPTGHQLSKIITDLLGIRNSTIFQEMETSREYGGFYALHGHRGDGVLVEFLPARTVTFTSHSMIGRKRMDNLHACMNRIIEDKILGDFMETGVWKGGATIFMRGFLQAHGVRDRKVWVADSFEGLPQPRLKEDDGFDFTVAGYEYLAVSEEEVRNLLVVSRVFRFFR